MHFLNSPISCTLHLWVFLFCILYWSYLLLSASSCCPPYSRILSYAATGQMYSIFSLHSITFPPFNFSPSCFINYESTHILLHDQHITFDTSKLMIYTPSCLRPHHFPLIYLFTVPLPLYSFINNSPTLITSTFPSVFFRSRSSPAHICQCREIINSYHTPAIAQHI